jgi:nicotinamide mononucleotide adenylyltransferase
MVFQSIKKSQFSRIEFTAQERADYLEFSNRLFNIVARVHSAATFDINTEEIKTQLNNILNNVILEKYIGNPQILLNCFIIGEYECYSEYFEVYSKYFEVSTLIKFIELLNKCNKEKQRIILNNLQTKLKSIEQFTFIPF